MTIERTISIIKPDAICKNLIGVIISRFEVSGLVVVAIKMLQLTRSQAEEFYCEHRKKIFFNDLVNFFISGPVVVQVLEGEDAVRRSRDIIGATNPQESLSGTIRSDYADSYIRNAIHGSDSQESANREISYFFNENEICSRSYSYCKY